MQVGGAVQRASPVAGGVSAGCAILLGVKISELVEQLAGGEKKPAGDALVALGEVAVRPVLDVLCDEGSPVDWVTSAVVLRRIGLPALDPLIEAMATASSAEVARRCGWAHSGLEIDDLSVFVPGLGHPSPKVRDNTAYVLQLKGAAALPYVPDLIALLDDPDEDVRRRVVWALQEIGPGALSSCVTRGARPGGFGGVRWRPLSRSVVLPPWMTATGRSSGV